MMKKIIKQEKWVMLSTEKNGAIEINTTTKTWSLGDEMLQSSCIKPQHLYLTSADEIQKDYWFLFKLPSTKSSNSALLKCVELDEDGNILDNNGQWCAKEHCKKIDATTNRELVTYTIVNKYGTHDMHHSDISKSFVKYFAEKKGKVGDVEEIFHPMGDGSYIEYKPVVIQSTVYLGKKNYYGDNQYYFSCDKCREENCARGSEDPIELECNCGHITKCITTDWMDE